MKVEICSVGGKKLEGSNVFLNAHRSAIYFNHGGRTFAFYTAGPINFQKLDGFVPCSRDILVRVKSIKFEVEEV